MSIELPSPSPAAPSRFRLRLRWALWAGVAVASVLLVGAAANYVRKFRREALASIAAHRFRNAILDRQNLSDLPFGYDGAGEGSMHDVVSENGERMLSWRVWLTDHSLPLHPDSRADFGKPWNDPR